MKTIVIGLSVAALLFSAELTPRDRQKIEAALPAVAPVKAKKVRKILVTNLNMWGGKPRAGHASVPFSNYALEMMGRKTGAYTIVFSDDVSVLEPGSIQQFDAICFNNTVGDLFDDPKLRQSLLDFISSGKGFIGFHAAGATFAEWPRYDFWPEFGNMLGGWEDGGHPWKPEETLTIRPEEPDNPLNAALKGQEIQVADEVFQFRNPYSRDRVHVLLSVDTDKTDMDPKRHFLEARQKDRDFPMSWIKTYGNGRVFYTCLGHNSHIWWNPVLLQHFLAGMQYALGDLQADARPSAVLARQ